MSRSISKKTPIIAATVVAAVVGLGFVSTSGADFTASDWGQVDVDTATLSLSLTDAYGSNGTFNLNYPNLTPGDAQRETFTVTNTGSIDAVATFGEPFRTVNLPGDVDRDLLKFGIAGIADLVADFHQVDLGVIPAGETRSYDLVVLLDQSADNDWQGVHMDIQPTVTLTQR